MPSIWKNGLVPGSQRGQRVHEGFFATRADHVYLCDLLSIPVIAVPGERVLLAVDLRELDPTLIDPDEDMVQQSYWSPSGPWLSPQTPPPERQTAEGIEVDGQEGALAQWAEQTPGFDEPEVTNKSLAAGRVSYHGVVQVDAISEIDHPSETASFFALGAGRVLGSDVLLPDVPSLGFYTTEVGRAYALAAHVMDASRSLAAPETSQERTHFDLPEQALPIQEELMRLARERRRAGDFGPANVLSRAAKLAGAVSGFEPECGWSATKDQCVSVAEAATECLDAVAQHHGADDAKRVAVGALEAVTALTTLRPRDVS